MKFHFSPTTTSLLTPNIGHTFIELLLFIAILTIGVLSFVPITDYIQKQRLQVHTEQLVQLIQSAQNQSVTAKNDKFYGFILHPHSYDLVSFTDEQLHYETNQVFNLPKTITLNFVSPAPQIAFTKKQGRLHTSLASPIQLTLETKKFQTTVTIVENGLTEFTLPQFKTLP